ncbi:hypothetical protein GGTG_13031 [Gaeumannomyces tritici R3-111a-1]|uniref:Deoxyribonuclease NucA/NucB domain-containing protein n=1 Tax=Gaeumannomyces tritici (strain R3-111a-1) TaxID=644352 RepID=J3PHQ0_GAET3|nr:hypothetical protein GGTG_13031 [Gaeumannomyces tritici R3-111a-1]EJT69412.1 hypothetical protein GGTG_13031 [Gaeumannomyces tritici R3-111a-1]
MHPLAAACAVLAAGAAANATWPAVLDWDCAETLDGCESACYAAKMHLVPDVLAYDAHSEGWLARGRRSGAELGLCNDSDLARNPRHERVMHTNQYPPASTRQGGEGAVLRCVTLADKLGSDSLPLCDAALGSGGLFYNYNMSDGDLFEVAIRNYAGIAYCPHGAALDDAPWEFKLKDGQVVDAWEPEHHRRDFANIFVHASVGVNLREYEDEYGDRVLSLSRNATSSLVGRTISNGQRGLTIMKEILPQGK